MLRRRSESSFPVSLWGSLLLALLALTQPETVRTLESIGGRGAPRSGRRPTLRPMRPRATPCSTTDAARWRWPVGGPRASISISSRKRCR